MRKFAPVSSYLVDSINLPKRATEFSAGYDFESAEETFVLNVGEIKAVKTGVKVYMNTGEYLQLQIRSSLALNAGIQLLNSPAVIDKDYCDNPKNEGEIMFILRNSGKCPYMIEKGQRIGQGVFLAFLMTDDDVAGAKRNGGTGSTGK
jgi:dUTP pyrophosphatase